MFFKNKTLKEIAIECNNQYEKMYNTKPLKNGDIIKVCKCEDYVTCEDCSCVIDKNDAQVIKVFFPVLTNYSIYYCERCKKPYSEVQKSFDGLPMYFKKFHVDENGEPVGYKKISK